MKTTLHLFFYFFVVLTFAQTPASLPAYEGFDYTVGDKLINDNSQTGKPNWYETTLVATGDALIATSPSWTATGLPTPIGNALLIQGAGSDPEFLFEVSPSTTYASFLLKVSTLGSMTTTGNYFATFAYINSSGVVTRNGNITIRLDVGGSGYNIGINNGTSAVPSYSTTVFNVNEEVFLVMKKTSTGDCFLFINPTVGATEPTPTLSGGNRTVKPTRIVFNQLAAASTPGMYIDELRVAATWEGVTPALTTPTSTTWNGSWSNGNPTASLEAIINSAYSTTANGGGFTAKKLTVNSAGSLTINSGTNLTITNEVINNSSLGVTGIVVENNANLIQGGTTNANTGNITVKRNSNALYRSDYTIWSSPVTNSGFFLKDFSLSTLDTRFYNYNETTNKYSAVTSPSTTPFATASGYLIRMPNNGNTAYEAGDETLTYFGEFTGVPNNGTITKAITYFGSAPFGYNMVGNPYPSTIDADLFIAANTANIESSLYFWRKVNAAVTSAYAVYNALGSTATASSEVPSGTIQVGQGFFVKAKSASNITFTNLMRVDNNANQFFKTKQVQKDRLWLNLTTASGVFSQALIGYTDAATSGVDMYDAKYIDDSPIALTSSINNEEYSIQGRPAFDRTDVVALNFKTDAAGDYSIALDHFDGVFAAAQEVYLVDSNTGAETNLKEGPYTFTAAVGTDNARFSLKFQKTLKVIDAALDNNSVSVYQNNGAIYINSKSAVISSVKVFDVQGRLLAEQKNVKANTAVISILKAKNQLLIVKVVGEDNSEVSKKVMN